MRKIIAYFLISLTILPTIAVSQINQAKAADTTTVSTSITDTGDGEDDTSLYFSPNVSTDYVTSIYRNLSDMQGRRSTATTTTETSLAKLGMSQCDQQLVRSGQIDERVLESLNYLVAPVDQGGAGMTYIFVTFGKSCVETSSPDSIGEAYPVVFDGETEDPNNPGYPLIKTASSDFNNNVASIETQKTTSVYKSITKVISSVQAADGSGASNEPSGVENVHKKGQAADITAAGLVMCTTKSGGVMGVGSKITRQAPRPIKVAWQTDSGVANVQSPFGNSYASMATTSGLDEFLAGFASSDGTYQAQALQSAFTMMGYNLLANQIGINANTFDANTASLDYRTLGYAALSDLLELPNSSVFNQYIANTDQSTTISSQSNVQKLLTSSLLRTVEKDLDLSSGSLNGNSVEEVMTNAGKRYLEKALNLQNQSLGGKLDSAENVITSIGRAKLESFYRLPTGTASTTVNTGAALNALITNATKSLGLSSTQTSYATSLVKGALNLPSTVSISDLTNKNSSFWTSAEGAKYKTQLSSIDQKLFPSTGTGNAKSVFDQGDVTIFDRLEQTNTSDYTYKFVVGEVSLADYESMLGYGSVLSGFGSYSSASSAYGLPIDQQSYYTSTNGTNHGINTNIFGGTNVPSADSTVHRYNRNQFLSELIKGNKNYWVALGVNAVAKSLNMSSEKIFSQTTNDGVVLQNSGLVFDAINGKRVFNFSSANASMSVSLTPDQFLNVIGSFLAADSSSSNYKTAAARRENILSSLVQTQLNYNLDSFATKTIGDSTLAGLIYQYDKSRATTADLTESFPITSSNALTFRLSQKATKVSSLTITDREGAPLTPTGYTLSADGYTITLKNNQFNNLGSNTLTVNYSALATKSASSSQLTSSAIYSLLSDSTALNNIALQYGAIKTAKALNLAPTALLSAASLLSTVSSSGINGVGQSTLENIAGLTSGGLNGDNWKTALTQVQATNIFRLESGDYSRIANGDSGYISSIATQLGKTDDYYHIDYGSTSDLFNNKITFAEYKKRIGNAQLRYCAGTVLASKFGISVAGYRLSGQDFYDIIDGSYFSVLQRIGQRITEKNHGLPVGALATSLLTGTNNVSLYALGTNIVASAFHLNSIDLTNANSLADVQSEIGQSTIEQALGFNPNSFTGDSVLAVAKKVGAESFASAYGIILPDSVKNQLNAITYSYNATAAKTARDNIIYNYLSTNIGPSVGAEGHFSDATTKRFALLDQSFGIETGSTLKMMQGSLSPDEYNSLVSKRAIADGITGELVSVLGLSDKYSFIGKDVVNALLNGKNFDAFQSLVGGFGGTYVDAQIGWSKGTFVNLLNNMNNIAEIRRTLIEQGSVKLEQITGVSASSLQRMFYGDYAVGLGEAVAKKLDIAGFSAAEAQNLFNGHFTLGMEYVGAALMANTDDMKAAGITYTDIRNSIVGNSNDIQNYINTKIANEHPELAAAGGDIALLYIGDLESMKRQYMTEQRQNLSYKYMDYQAIQLLSSDVAKYVKPGFSKAFLAGQYAYTDITGKQIILTGDAARWRYAKEFLLSYSVDNIPILKDIGIPADTLGILTDYAASHMGDENWLETQLTAKDGSGRTGLDKLGSSFDKLANQVFGIDLASGTGSALITYAFSGDTSKLTGNLWTSWQGVAFNWADQTLGLQSGTAMTIYQGITQYQSALSAYQSVSLNAMQSLSDAASVSQEAFNQALDQASTDISSASRQFKTQTAMIIAAVANVVFQKQFSQIESALGLQSGTLIYLIQYLIHPDPISLGLFIFFNFIWGKTTVTCGIDYYPLSGSTESNQANASVTLINSAITAQTANTSTTSAAYDSNSTLDSQLSIPKTFNGQSNSAYQKGIKAGAQYEVKRLLGSILLMPSRTSNSNLKPYQIGTYSSDDVNYFESITTTLYGNLATRPSKLGTGWYSSTTDRVHLGF